MPEELTIAWIGVIGADEETTKRLLLEIGARSSEDGRPLWALIRRQPLPSSQ